MKTRIWTILCTVLLVALLAGCKQQQPQGNGGDNATDKKTVTVWWAQWAPADGLQELGNEFEKETGIAVKVEQIPWASYQDKVFKNFGNKQTDFDIVVGDSQWIGVGAVDGLYLELTDWLPTAVDMTTVHPQAKAFYEPGRYVPLVGYEWTHHQDPLKRKTQGDHNNYFRDPDHPLLNHSELSQLARTLSTEDALIIR